MKGRLEMLDVSRGIAASMVVLFHFVSVFDPGSYEGGAFDITYLFKYGYVGVDIFFVISGFVICLSLDRYSKRRNGLVGFLGARIIRLTPAYWVLIGLLSLKIVVESLLEGVNAESRLDVGQVVSNMLYVQSFFGYEDLLPVFWTLCYEIQFYIIFGLFYMRVKRSDVKNKELIVGAVVFFAGLLSMFSFFSGQAFVSKAWMFSYFHFFALGILAFMYARGRVDSLVFVLFISFYLIMVAIGSRGGERIVAPVFAILLVLFVHKNIFLEGGKWQWLLNLGLISYSLYIVHPVVGWKVVYLLNDKIDVNMAWQVYVILGVGFVVSFAFSYVFYKMIEERSVQWAAFVGERLSAGRAEVAQN